MKIGIAGITGRMGMAVMEAASEMGGVTVAAGSVRPGRPVPELHVPVVDSPEKLVAASDVIIDFTTPEQTLELAKICAKAGKPLISGTTGMTDADMAALANAAGVVPILWSSNLSIGVAVLTRLVRAAATTLDTSFDIEILEMHHRHKKDAPSGTALSLGKAAAEARGAKFNDVAVLSREGITGEREAGTIGFATLRGGEVVGDHTVIFAGSHERIELTHKSSSRGIYAHGAIHAGKWIIGKAPKLYSMQDMLP